MSKHIHRNGLSIGIERTGNEIYLTIRAVGRLTHDDYGLITPMIESALAGLTAPRIKAFCDVSRLDGWQVRAAWDDFKLGLKHGSEFEKVAILGNKQWQFVGTKVGSWFMSGKAKFFEDETKALAWLTESPVKRAAVR